MLKNTRLRKEKKHLEAKARQESYDKLSLEEKLRKAKKGGR